MRRKRWGELRGLRSIFDMQPSDRATATFRFYEELNDFLPREQRKRDIVYRCARAAIGMEIAQLEGRA